MLKNNKLRVTLRALEPEDLDFLFCLENDESLWEVSETQVPFSRYLLQHYIENSHRDIYEMKQLRMVISYNEKAIGCVDLYDFDVKNKRAGVGIVLISEFRGKGLAEEALLLLSVYAKKYLHLHQIFAYISERNVASQKLFEKLDFEKTGVKKDWLYNNRYFENQITYQKFL